METASDLGGRLGVKIAKVTDRCVKLRTNVSYGRKLKITDRETPYWSSVWEICRITDSEIEGYGQRISPNRRDKFEKRKIVIHET